MKSLLLLPLLALLSGCLASLDGAMENRITTTLDCKRGFVASLYGPVGITSEIAGADVAHLPCHLRAAPAPAAAASAAK